MAATPGRRLDRTLLVLLALVVIYTGFFSALWIRRHQVLFSYEFEDDAARNQMIYNTLRGRPFFSSLKGVYLAGHASLVWAVLAVPSLIHPGIESACVVLTLALGLTAVPVYLLGREALGGRWEALIMGLSALLYAPLHAVNLHTLNAVTPAVPLLAWALWAFHTRRYRTFLAFAVGAMLCKEDIAMAVMMFGLYGLLLRRGWRWSAVPMLIGAVWLAVAFKVILPATYPKEHKPTSWIIGAVQSEAEGGPGGLKGAIDWMLRHPTTTLRWMFWPTRAILFSQLFLPVGLVCLLAPGALLMAVPAMGLLLLHSPPLYLYHRHWIAPVIPFVLVGTVLGCSRLKRFFSSREGKITAPYALVLSLVLVGCLASNFLPNIIGFPTTPWGWPPPPREMLQAWTVYDPFFYRHTERSRNAWALIRMIPPRARVAASGDLLVPLSARPILFEFLDPRTPWRDVDYLLINTRPVHFGAGNYQLDLNERRDGHRRPEELPELHHRRVLRRIRRMLASGSWRLVERRGDIYLLKRVPSPPATHRRTVDSAPPPGEDSGR